MSQTLAKPIIRKFRLSDLEGAEYNPRGITDSAFAGLRESLSELGMLEMPVVNIADGKKRLVSGHQRVAAMKAEGITHADCACVSLDEALEKMANITMNNPAIQGSWDIEKALPSLETISVALPKPEQMRFNDLTDEIRREAEKMAKASAKKSEASSELPTTPPTPASKPNKVYKLGKHRLFSGPCEVGIPLLLGKTKAAACVTDPPYGVAYETSDGESIENDNLKGEAWVKFLSDITGVILKYTDGPCYVFMASKEIPALSRAWGENGGVIHRWLIWAKDRFTLSRGDYHHQYEPCLYGYKSGVVPANPETPRTNVLEFPKPKTNDLHPTQKPTDLIKALVLDCSKQDDVVIEPFGGSGTTLAVCEETGRVCMACELDLFHVDTIRKRWAEQVHGVGCDWKKLTKS